MLELFGKRRPRSIGEARHSSVRERIAAAQARVAADRLRGVETGPWIRELAAAESPTPGPRR